MSKQRHLETGVRHCLKVRITLIGNFTFIGYFLQTANSLWTNACIVKVYDLEYNIFLFFHLYAPYVLDFSQSCNITVLLPSWNEILMKGKVVYLMLHLMEVCQKCWQLIREWKFHRITRDYRNWDICRILVTSHTYGAYSWSSMTKIWVWIYMYIVIYNVQCILTNNLNSRRMN